MRKTKYGVWKVRYASNISNIFEDWVCRDGKPILFDSQFDAEEFMRECKAKNNNAFVEFSVRSCEVRE